MAQDRQPAKMVSSLRWKYGKSLSLMHHSSAHQRVSVVRCEMRGARQHITRSLVNVHLHDSFHKAHLEGQIVSEVGAVANYITSGSKAAPAVTIAGCNYDSAYLSRFDGMWKALCMGYHVCACLTW